MKKFNPEYASVYPDGKGVHRLVFPDGKELPHLTKTVVIDQAGHDSADCVFEFVCRGANEIAGSSFASVDCNKLEIIRADKSIVPKCYVNLKTATLPGSSNLSVWSADMKVNIVPSLQSALTQYMNASIKK